MRKKIQLTPLPRGAKREALTEAIAGLAKRLGPNAQLPGVRELCQSLKVSTATLDRVLGKLEQHGMIVCHHGRGIFVSPSVSARTVGFVFGGDVFSNGASPFWIQLVDAARTLSEKAGFGFRYYLDIPAAKRETATHGDLQRDLEEGRLNGLLGMTICSQEQLRWLEKWGAPVVLLTDVAWAKHWAAFDNRAAISAGVRELAARGCKRVAFIGQSHRKWSDAFESALCEQGLKYDRALHWDYEWYASVVPHETPEQFAYNLIGKTYPETRPDGLLIMDDTMTRGALMALRGAAVRPRRDVLIVTSANKGSPVLVPYEADLILLENDPELLVRKGFSMLQSLMRGKQPALKRLMIAPSARDGSSVKMLDNQNVSHLTS